MKPVSIVLVSLALLLSAAGFASDYYVEAASGPSTSDGELNTVTQLIKLAVQDSGGNSVVTDRTQADFILRPGLLRLGESYIVTLEKLRNGKVVFSSQLKAAHADELDKVSNRVTRAVVDEVRPKQDIRVGEVTDEEAKEGKQRKPALSGSFIGIGPALLSNLGTSTGIGFHFTVGHSWDVNIASVRVFWDGTTNGDAFLTNAGLGANYFFTNKDITPYIGADFGIGAAKAGGAGGFFLGESGYGFAVGGGAGLQLLRTTSINLEIGAKITALLHTFSTTGGLPLMYGLKLALYF